MSTYVAIPCMDQVPTEFMKNLLALKPQRGTAYGITVATLIYDARNILAKAVFETECDRVMWFDSDMIFDTDIMDRLSADIDEGRDFVTALYFTRKNPIKPVIFKNSGYKVLPDGMKESYAGFYDDYPRDDIFEIDSAGFGACMMTKKLLEEVYSNYGAPFAPMPGFGEDISFCKRCKDMGAKLYCDSKIRAGHIANMVVTQDTYDQQITL